MGKTAIDGAQRGTIFLVDPTDVVIVGLDTKHQRGEHPLWQARALEPTSESLAQNMTRHGFTSVISVRKDGPTLEVIAGRRRVKAARRANQLLAADGKHPLKIKVEVKRGSLADMVGLMISENALRKDVEPMEMAYDLNSMLQYDDSETGYARVAAAWGRGVDQLKSMLRLLDLDQQVQQAVRERRLKPTAAVALADLTRDKQVVELGKLLNGHSRPTVAAARAHVKASREGREDALQAPHKGLIRKLVNHENAVDLFGEDGVKALRYALGEVDSRQFHGLAETIQALRE